jgi:hypothetical protein
MKIVLATEEDIKPVADRYLVLELDTFRIKGTEIPSWCIVDAGDIGLADMTELAHFKEQHENLIRNYKKGDLNFVEQTWIVFIRNFTVEHNKKKRILGITL